MLIFAFDFCNERGGFYGHLFVEEEELVGSHTFSTLNFAAYDILERIVERIPGFVCQTN